MPNQFVGSLLHTINPFADRVSGEPFFTKDLNFTSRFNPSKDFVLDPNAWADPPAGRIGTAATYYNDYCYRRRPSENMSLGRILRSKEGVILSIRVELTNIFNRAQPNDPFSGNALSSQIRNPDALAAVDDPTEAKRDLDRITARPRNAAGRGGSAFSLLAYGDAELFQAIMDGEHCLRGFTNRDIRSMLQSTQHWGTFGHDHKKARSKMSPILRRLPAYGLIAKIPRSPRWRVTLYRKRGMDTALYVREHDSDRVHTRIAA